MYMGVHFFPHNLVVTQSDLSLDPQPVRKYLSVCFKDVESKRLQFMHLAHLLSTSLFL